MSRRPELPGAQKPSGNLRAAEGGKNDVILYANEPAVLFLRAYPTPNMATAKGSPKIVSEIIDHIELIREELLTVQNSLEKIEAAEPALSPKGSKKV